MADVPGQIENVIDAGDEVADNGSVCQICDMDTDSILYVFNVEDISALIFDQRINQAHLHLSNLDEALHQIAADEPQAARNQHRPAAISI